MTARRPTPQPILLNPGPVNVSERVRAALARGDMCHREPEFGVLLRETGERLQRAFAAGASHAVAFLTGSGTAAVEMGVLACTRPGRKLAIVVNGVYGARIAAMARAHRIECVTLECEWTERPDLGAVAELVADPDVDALALVHHETTTGLLNPVAEIARIASQGEAVLLLDTVSGLGGERLDLASVDLAMSTANKCLGGVPGLSFALVSDRARKRLEEVRPRSVYLDLGAYLRAQESGSPPFTPAIQTLWALDAALEELIEEGVERRIERFGRIAAYLRGAFEDMGLELLLRPEVRSNTITSVCLPAGLSYEELHDELREAGFVIYAGQGRIATEVFRVANMGRVSLDDYQRFVGALRRIIA